MPYSITHVRAADSTDLSLLHFERQTQAPTSNVVLLEPGLLENAAMLERVARGFYDKGYDVYIGQVRLAGRPGERSGRGQNNGLEEVLLLDMPAHLREVIARHPNAPISLVGHSMGGMEILAALSSPTLGPELSPHVKAVTVIAAPADLHGIPRWLHLQCKIMMPIFRKLVALTGPIISTHTSIFDFFEHARQSPNRLVAASLGKLENWLIDLASLAVNGSAITTRKLDAEGRRKFWEDGVAPLPMDLLLDFARAAASGEFLSRAGEKLIVPERITVPVEVVRATSDAFTPADNQAELFERLGSKIKQLVDLVGFRHVDPVVLGNPESGFLAATLRFQADPGGATRAAPKLEFVGPSAESRPNCEAYLSP